MLGDSSLLMFMRRLFFSHPLCQGWPSTSTEGLFWERVVVWIPTAPTKSPVESVALTTERHGLGPRRP